MRALKRVLIVSSDPLSTTSNNGKTLASFFDTYPPDLLAQLYFSSSKPDSKICNNFYKISDMDMLRSRWFHNNQCGGKFVAETALHDDIKKDYANTLRIKKNNFTRLLREALWNNNWKTNELQNWLDEFRPELIFFVAGDIVFSYKIVTYIKEKYTAKLAIYITDDYILPRFSCSVFWWIRRNWVFRYMKKAVQSSDLFFTISPIMKDRYKNVFHKESHIIVNMPQTFTASADTQCGSQNTLELVYAGGLHLNRYKTLMLLARSIDRVNRQRILDKKIVLKIYSNQPISVRKLKKIQLTDSSVFGGGLSSDQLFFRLQKADFLVHVESFRYKNICDTRLSLSTKIPEYMSYRKPIIAIGPKNIASMQYILDCACCITKTRNMDHILTELFCNTAKQRELADKAYNKYAQNHNKEHNQKVFLNFLSEL